MKASDIVNRLVQLIALHGDKQMRIGEECVICIVDDQEKVLGTPEQKIFRIIPTGEGRS